MTKEPIVVHAIINGEFVPSENKYPRENPTNPSEIVGYGPLNTREETIRAIDAAEKAFTIWKNNTMDERIERMQRAIQKIKDHTDELAEILSREHGKALYDAKGEFAVSLMWMEYACNTVKDVLQEKIEEHDNGRTIITQDPIGVVSAITPWNYPISLSTIKHQYSRRTRTRCTIPIWWC